MKLTLNSNNLSQYLLEANILQKNEVNSIKINFKSSYGSDKLIVLSVDLANKQQILIKQDHYHDNSKKINTISKEFHFQKFIQSLSYLESVTSHIIKLLYFDKINSILIYEIPQKYICLKKKYNKNKLFPTEIAKSIGTTLAVLHRETSSSYSCHDFMSRMMDGQRYFQFSHPSHLLDRLEPETLIKEFPPEGNRFIAFYQSSETLRNKVSELVANNNCYCLTHNRLEFNNILINRYCQEQLSSSQSSEKKIIKFINWQQCSWGDPAFDLATVSANYLLLWVESLIMHPAIKLEKSLQLATIPLNVIQPSIVTLTCYYISSFPEVLEKFPDFINRVVQFTGLVLIYKIIENIQSFEGFNNREICILQLAKSLLCYPEKSFFSVFGMSKVAFDKLIFSSKVNEKFVVE